MILRCEAPRKGNRFRKCDRWLAAVPDGSHVVGIVRHHSLAHPQHLVVACASCHTLWEIRPAKLIDEAA